MSSFTHRVAGYVARGLNRVGIHTKDKKDYSFVTGASEILEINYGHFRSVKQQQAVNGNGDPIPWFTYPAIDYLDQLSYGNKTMLEWGSGNSSLFFSKRVAHLYSVEHNNEWFNHVKSFQIQNQEIILKDQKSYAAAGRDFKCVFDVILIDGVERHSCAEISSDLLKPGGFIILDNSDRHPDIAENFRKKNFIQIDFHGLGPINPYTWTTSLFLTRDFNFVPEGRQPKIPAGGGF